jgi:isoamylase
MPMILMGDEVLRTQIGNNETSWFDWGLLAKHAYIHRFVSQLNARRLVRALGAPKASS